jgi:hypothetical protein
VPTRDLRYHGALRAGLRHDLRLDVVAPTTASGPHLQRANNIRNHVAIRSLHNGTHIAGLPAYNKVGKNNRLRLKWGRNAFSRSSSESSRPRKILRDFVGDLRPEAPAPDLLAGVFEVPPIVGVQLRLAGEPTLTLGTRI